jgi:two-component system LytT family sensor kinase
LNFQKIVYWLFQISGWFGIALFLFIINKANNVAITPATIIVLFYFALLGITISHFLRFFFIRFHLLDGLSLKVFSVVLALCLFAAIVFQVFYDVLVYSILQLNGGFNWSKFFGQVVVMSTLFGTWSLVYFLNHFIRKNRMSEVENLKLLAQKQTAELALMRAQLNPHFLFNSLNSIRALISENQNEAKNGISRLSNILRSILIYSRRDTVSVEEEMQFVRDYLELEKIRFEERLNFDLQVDQSLLSFQVPPMCIQSLVENAVKHGIGQLREGGLIVVQLYKTTEGIEILVINDGALSGHGDTRVGLENTIMRLKTIFEERVSLDLFEIDQKVHAKIKIEL